MKEKSECHSITACCSKTPAWVDIQQEDDEAIDEILLLLKRFMASVRNDLNVLPLQAAISLLQHAMEEDYSNEELSILCHHLIRALLTRYSFFGCIKDLETCVGLHCKDNIAIVVARGTTGRNIEKVEEIQTAIQLIDECRQSVDTATLDDIIEVATESIQLYTEGKQVLQKAELLILLGNAIGMRYLDCLGERDRELTYTANKFREAEYLCRGDVPLTYICLTAQAHVGWLQATECGRREGMVDACDHMGRALAIDNAAAKSFEMGSKMAEEAFEISQLEKAITHLRFSLGCRMRHHPQRFSTLEELANALTKKYGWGRGLEDLEECILLRKEGLRLMPTQHPNRTMWLNNLTNDLYARFKRKGAHQDLEECILLHRKALDLQPSHHHNRWCSINNLASCLLNRFQQRGEIRDLEGCILLYREALDLFPHPHPNRSDSLNNLAGALSTRFQQQGAIQDLEEAILLHREVLGLFPHPHTNRSISLNNLAIALWNRFEQKGAMQDLEECILLHREALDLRPHLHPDRAGSLNNLASALWTRFEQKGTIQDLEESILLQREALDFFPHPHPDRSNSLNNLAGALSIRFEQKGAIHDLEESILLHREALELRPYPHPGRSDSLNNLASALSTRVTQKGSIQDLEECILLDREALDLLPHSHPNRSRSLNNLANALSDRFKQMKAPGDFEEATQLHQEALELRCPPHPDRLQSLKNLAVLHRHRYGQKNEVADLEQALLYFELAARYETGPILGRLNSVKARAALARMHHPTASLDAYLYALELLPQLASFDLTLKQRKDVLEHSRDLVGNATQCAISQNQLETAVVFLSTSRSIFWSQALQLRTPVDYLAAFNPSLAKTYLGISRQLEQASHDSTYHSHRSLASDRHTLNQPNFTSLSTLVDRRRQAIEDIRKIPGFEGFLLPPSFLSLKHASRNGPVILLNASEFGCDALIMLESGAVAVVPLPDINLAHLEALRLLVHRSLAGGWRSTDVTQPEVQIAIDVLQTLLPRDFVPESEGFQPLLPDMDLHALRFVLGILWDNVVRHVVEALAFQKTSSPKRIWWCPSGLFASLPIHAAGKYSENEEPVDCLFQYAVSSYCTSPKDLLDPQTQVSPGFEMAAIIEPEAPGGNHLPFTVTELERIMCRIPDQCQRLIVRLGSKDAPNQIEDVLSDIQQSSIVHFGCHGNQNLCDPLDSYLLLSGGKLTISRIIKECQVSNSAGLAYLSACETAKGDEDRLDESLNLVASMMFAGFRGVVGTMWSIFDHDAPIVADVFYGYLFRNGKDAPIDAAYGLHLATQHLRERGSGLRSWVPYVHYGI